MVEKTTATAKKTSPVKEKTVKKIEPQNPDMKLATRGYVKCLLRKTRNHQHMLDLIGGCWWFLGLVFGWMFTIVIAVVGPGLVASTWFPALVAFALVCTIGFTECYQMDSEWTAGIKSDEPAEIKKWEPPKCENKEDCY